MYIQLLTGIPRSGTTLCCRILNECPTTVALHEPINPQQLRSTAPADAIDEVLTIAESTYQNLLAGNPLDHGDSSLLLDNPVETISTQAQLRRVKAKRGQIQLAAQPEGTRLIIKQNALFTALLPTLANHLPVTAVVRNPVPVVLSWMTVNLPVNRGTLPAAERFDHQLNDRLDALPLLQRYATIYNWFVDNFIKSGIPVIRYEDIVSTNGSALSVALTGETVNYSMITPPAHRYEKRHIQQLSEVLCLIQTQGLYGDDEINDAVVRVTQNL